TGIVTPSRGRIALKTDGGATDLIDRTPEAIVDLGVALVPEGRRLFPALSVEENLTLGAYRPAARTQIAANLASVCGVCPALRARPRRPAGSMCGGEQQMVALGRALRSAPTCPDRRALGRARADAAQPGDRQDQGAEGAPRP